MNLCNVYAIQNVTLSAKLFFLSLGSQKQKTYGPSYLLGFLLMIVLFAPAEQYVYRILRVIKLHSSGVLCSFTCVIHHKSDSRCIQRVRTEQ